MRKLNGQVAVVTGASRGLGKGIALGLGEAGATVYVTGRSANDGKTSLPGTIEETAAEVTRLGGEGIAVYCDHRVDGDVEALFGHIGVEQGRLDLLVNNAFASPEQRVLWGGLARGDGLIINVASHAAGSGKTARSRVILPYSVSKAGVHRLSADMAVELRDMGIAVVSVWPPASKTEGTLAQPEVFGDISGWRPPIFTGRVVAAFVAGGDALARSGEALVIEDLADELGITDPTSSPQR